MVKQSVLEFFFGISYIFLLKMHFSTSASKLLFKRAERTFKKKSTYNLYESSEPNYKSFLEKVLRVIFQSLNRRYPSPFFSS